MGRIIKPGTRAFREAYREIASPDEFEEYSDNHPTFYEKAKKVSWDYIGKPACTGATIALLAATPVARGEEPAEEGAADEYMGLFDYEESPIALPTEKEIQLYGSDTIFKVSDESGSEEVTGRISGLRLFNSDIILEGRGGDNPSGYIMTRTRPDGLGFGKDVNRTPVNGAWAIDFNYLGEQEHQEANFGDLDQEHTLYSAELLTKFAENFHFNLKGGLRKTDIESKYPRESEDVFGVVELGASDFMSNKGILVYYGDNRGGTDLSGEEVAERDYGVFGVKGFLNAENFAMFGNKYWYALPDNIIISDEERQGWNMGVLGNINGYVPAISLEKQHGIKSESFILGYSQEGLKDDVTDYYSMLADTALGWTMEDVQRKGLADDEMLGLVSKANWMLKLDHSNTKDGHCWGIDFGGTHEKMYGMVSGDFDETGENWRIGLLGGRKFHMFSGDRYVGDVEIGVFVDYGDSEMFHIEDGARGGAFLRINK